MSLFAVRCSRAHSGPGTACPPIRGREGRARVPLSLTTTAGPDFSPTLTHFTADVLQSRALQVNLIHFVSLTGDQGGKK